MMGSVQKTLRCGFYPVINIAWPNRSATLRGVVDDMDRA